MTNQPKILSTHRVGSVRITRFLSRFGDVVWFIDDATNLPQEQVGRLRPVVGFDLFQGERAAAKRWLRIHWPAIKAGVRPRPEERARRWLPDGWSV